MKPLDEPNTRALIKRADRWMKRAIAAEARVTAVRAIHIPSTDHPPGTDPYCFGCWEAGGEDGAPSWPCPTVEALNSVRDSAERDTRTHYREICPACGVDDFDHKPDCPIYRGTYT